MNSNKVGRQVICHGEYASCEGEEMYERGYIVNSNKVSHQLICHGKCAS